MRYLAESSPRVRSRLQRQDIDLERLRIVFREDKAVQAQKHGGGNARVAA